MTPLLSARGVTRRFGARVCCDGVSFDLWSGEVMGIVGESGSGKSTLLNCLAGHLAPDAGAVIFDTRAGGQKDVLTMSEPERRMLGRTDWAFVRQDPRDGLRMGVSAGGNVGERLMAVGARRYGDIRARAADWLARVDIDADRIDDRPAAFSGGMRQRLQIARNLVTGPRLIFMDEPTGGLDVSVQARLLDLLRGLVRELGLAAVIVTHDLAVARLLADRLMVMKSGLVVETGLTDQVLDDPQHAYTQLLVGSVLQVLAMMRAYELSAGGLEPSAAHETAVWVDLMEPDEDERVAAAALLGFPPPTQAEQQEIELSSRLYMQDGAVVMTAILPAHTDTDQAEMGPVTFILTEDRLVTLRHHAPRPFDTYPGRAERSGLPCRSAQAVFFGLIEDIIGRLADLTEYAGRKIEQLTNQVFFPETGARADLRKRLYKLGWRDALVTHIRDALVTIERMLGFLRPILERRNADKTVLDFLDTLLRDARTISEQASFLNQKTAFLLDAMLGLINIEQSAITKMFSIVAVVFLPATLVASVYGMNFAGMPELTWEFGYPAAIVAMLVFSLAPLLYFRWKGWF